MKNDRNYPNGTSRLAKPKLEKFAFYRAGGKTLAESYELAGAKTGISSKSAAVGGSRLAAIPGVRARIAYLQQQIPAKPDHPMLDNGAIPKTPRDALLARLWQIVNSDNNPEAIQAVRALRAWLREDAQAAKDSDVADPAIICKHLSAIRLEYEDMDAAQRLQYAARVVDNLDKLGIMRADVHAASAPVPENVPIIPKSVVNSVAIQAPITTQP